LLLIEGVRLFQGRLRLLYQTAVFCVDNGMNDAATSLVDYALKVAPDEKTKATFEKLKATLPPLPPAAPAPTSAPAKPAAH